MIRTSAILVVSFLAVPAAASLHQPDEPMTVPVKPDGVGEPLPFEEFRSRMVTLANSGDPRPNAEGKPNRDRVRVLDRVHAFAGKPKPSAGELAAHAVDLLHLGNTDPRPGDPGLYVDKALNLLAPHTRDRVQNYFVLTTLAEIHAARGEWREAMNVHNSALLDAELPAVVPGWSEPQRKWIRKLDDDYVPEYYSIRLAEAESKKSPETEEPTPLFPLASRAKPVPPVKFVNDAGQYEPGVLAKAERDKLPPDAIAIVQQLLLWFPSDTRLYWLLAELYTAEGKFEEAQVIFDQCVGPRVYSNRRLLMEHRTAVAAAIEARRKAEEQANLDAYPINLRLVWLYFGGVVLIAAIAFLRGRRKRPGNGAMPACCG